MSRLIPIIFVLSIACGCQTLSHRADPAWLNDFARTDMIELRTKIQTQRISDSDTINQLQQIYANANWQVYRHTLPASIVERTIHLYDDDKKYDVFATVTYFGSSMHPMTSGLRHCPMKIARGLTVFSIL